MHMQLIGGTDMKKKQYRESKLKYQLENMKAKDKKSVLWKLTKSQREFVENIYPVEPELYRIRTRYFSKEICERYPILKRLNNEKKYKHHSYIVTTRLKKKDFDVLKEFDIPYTEIKYRIFLV